MITSRVNPAESWYSSWDSASPFLMSQDHGVLPAPAHTLSPEGTQHLGDAPPGIEASPIVPTAFLPATAVVLCADGVSSMRISQL